MVRNMLMRCVSSTSVHLFEAHLPTLTHSFKSDNQKVLVSKQKVSIMYPLDPFLHHMILDLGWEAAALVLGVLVVVAMVACAGVVIQSSRLRVYSGRAWCRLQHLGA